MAGYKYYAGSHTIQKFAEATDTCANGVALPKTSYFPFENGYDNESKSHNPIVIRKKLLGNNKIPLEATLKAPFSNRTQRWTEYNGSLIDKLSTDMCCDQIEIVYEDFNQNDLLQPFKKYRITYFAERNNSGGETRYSVYKSVEAWAQQRDDAGACDWPASGQWKSNCPECVSKELIRDHIEDMEFVPFDANGIVLKNMAGDFPTPEGDNDIRSRLFDITGVDVRLTFRSKDNFYKETQKREVVGLDDRQIEAEDRILRDSVIVTVNTRNIGGTLF